MKKIIFIIIICFMVSLMGCADSKNINGITYETYGLFNEDEKRNDSIHYEISYGNIIWGIILCETIIAPIYFFGFSLYEPVSYMDHKRVKGSI